MYLLVCCVTVLVFGRLGDLRGKVRIFQVGVVLFTIGSFFCGMSTAGRSAASPSSLPPSMPHSLP